AVGLESPDPRGAARRAEALLAPVLPRRRAPGDTPLEAVAAPDGTELFFCATGRPGLPDWRADFEKTGAEVGTEADAAWRVDHLSLTQPWHQFDEAALFHRAVLGLRPQESVDVADPYGLLRSRAVSTDDGAVR
ncbi:sugar phosphate isomerase/epimerase and 4-hydroxyphenylpyruvate domain-containing protein, partial [Streptomyces sp. SID5789]|nr:sugar phosphate isomerase/epimerase and 4-hydroxyphenylpyruvate domain-containing protein [Streptomyces sp. SID5789]